MSDVEKKDQKLETEEWESPVLPPPIKEKGGEGPDPKSDWESPVIPPPTKGNETGDEASPKEWEPPIGPPAK